MTLVNPQNLLDVNVSIGHYPFRRFPFDSQDPALIAGVLRGGGVARAWASSLHAVFYGDPQQGNEELLPRLVGDDFFRPVGVVNPSLHNWQETLDHCVEAYGCAMVKLYPSYHMYRLTDPCVEAFLAAARERGILVAIAQRVEDERSHHGLMMVPPPELADVAGTAQRHRHPLLLLSAYHGEIRQLAASTENLFFDIACAETMNTMESLTRDVSPRRLLFGSHAPFLYPEAAGGKLGGWQAQDDEIALVARDNLTRLLSLQEREANRIQSSV